MNAKVLSIPGEGVGQEILDEARAVLDLVAQDFGHSFTFEEMPLGQGPAELASAARRADAALLGVGEWDGGVPAQVLAVLRRELGLPTTVRPFRIFPQLFHALPLRPERFRGVDVLVVSDSRSFPAAPHVVLERAFALASGRWHLVTSVESPPGAQPAPGWRDAAFEVARRYGGGVRLEHVAMDHVALRFVTSPTQFDVVAAPAPLADALIEQAATLGGSPWLLAGGAVGDAPFGAYFPLHGPHPQLARTGAANPVGGILAAALLLRHSLGLEREASAVEAAVGAAIAHGARTTDLSSTYPLTTRAMGDAIRANLATDFSTSRAI